MLSFANKRIFHEVSDVSNEIQIEGKKVKLVYRLIRCNKPNKAATTSTMFGIFIITQKLTPTVLYRANNTLARQHVVNRKNIIIIAVVYSRISWLQQVPRRQDCKPLRVKFGDHDCLYSIHGTVANNANERRVNTRSTRPKLQKYCKVQTNEIASAPIST